MIKAEVINHEGNPGPNWLDHCKTVITPWSITVAVIIAAVVFTLAATNRSRDVGQANEQPLTSHSQQTGSLAPLQVTPLASATAVQPTAAASSVQTPAATATASSTASSSGLGAKSTPSLNTAANGSGTGASSSSTVGPAPVNQNLQSTITGTAEAAKKLTDTLSGLTNPFKP